MRRQGWRYGKGEDGGGGLRCPRVSSSQPQRSFMTGWVGEVGTIPWKGNSGSWRGWWLKWKGHFPYPLPKLAQRPEGLGWQCSTRSHQLPILLLACLTPRSLFPCSFPSNCKFLLELKPKCVRIFVEPVSIKAQYVWHVSALKNTLAATTEKKHFHTQLWTFNKPFKTLDHRPIHWLLVWSKWCVDENFAKTIRLVNLVSDKVDNRKYQLTITITCITFQCKNIV